MLGSSLLAAIAVATTRETYDLPLREIDGRPARAPEPAVVPRRQPTGARLA